MTPPAATVAGRRSTAPRPGRSSRVGGGRPPRRVSGPARPAPARAAAAAAAVALPRHAPQPSAPPRRRPAVVPRPARRPNLPLGARALAWLRELPDHRLLDRLISGRVWIVLLGTLLVGIVTLQLTLLRLNAGIGRAIEQSSALEQRNAALRADVSQLSNAEQIVAQAAQMGYVWPAQGSPRFLTAGPADAARALTTMQVPNPTPAPPPATAAPPTTAAPVATTGTTTAGTTTAGTTAAGSTPTGTTAPASATPAPTPAAVTPAAPASQAAAGGASAPVGGQG